MKILFTFTPAFDPNSGGVQRTTWKLGKYFTENGYTTGYYSFAQKDHVAVEYGELFHTKESGGTANKKNIDHLKSIIYQFDPDFVINQMPYAKEIGYTLANLKRELNFVALGCLRNSLFNFKNNARATSQRILPSSLFKVLDNPVGIKLIKINHWFKHRYKLRRILQQHDFLYYFLRSIDRNWNIS